jgi:hypothetical protein
MQSLLFILSRGEPLRIYQMIHEPPTQFSDNDVHFNTTYICKVLPRLSTLAKKHSVA